VSLKWQKSWLGNRARDWILSLEGDVQKGAQGVPLTSPPAVKHTHRTFVVNGTHTHCQSHSHTISYYSCAREPPHADDPIWNCNDESFESIVNKYIEMVALHKALKKSLADITCFTWGLSLHCFARSVRHLKLLVYHSFKLLLVWTY